MARQIEKRREKAKIGCRKLHEKEMKKVPHRRN
jgi:hypothetical protein